MKLSYIYEGRIRRESEFISKVLNANSKWLMQFNINLNDPHQYRKEGGVGAAIIFNDKVVKFTSDIREYATALKLEDKNIPNIAKVYGTRSVGDIDKDGKTEFIIVIEKVNTDIPNIYKKAGNILYGYLDQIDLYKNVGGLENFKNKSINQIFNDILSFTTKSKVLRPLKKDKNLQKILYKLITALKNIYKYTGLVFVDIHGKNIGYKNGEIMMFDFGRVFK